MGFGRRVATYMLDTNGDGKLDYRDLVNYMDTNGNGRLDMQGKYCEYFFLYLSQ
jgi:hypothetical protein